MTKEEFDEAVGNLLDRLGVRTLDEYEVTVDRDKITVKDATGITTINRGDRL